MSPAGLEQPSISTTRLTATMGCSGEPLEEPQAESTGGSVERSPGFVERPLGAAVADRCKVTGGVHLIRLDTRVDSPGRLDVAATGDDEDLAPPAASAPSPPSAAAGSAVSGAPPL